MAQVKGPGKHREYLENQSGFPFHPMQDICCPGLGVLFPVPADKRAGLRGPKPPKEGCPGWPEGCVGLSHPKRAVQAELNPRQYTLPQSVAQVSPLQS